MAAGDSNLVAAQTRAQFLAASDKLRGEAFSSELDFSRSNSNILSQLQGEGDSEVPFAIKQDLAKGAMDTVNFPVGTTLGQAGRRGADRLVNFEEPLFQNSWSVQIDVLRVAVAWNELVRWAAAAGMSWESAYPMMLGERLGQIEQEDMLCRLRQRSSVQNTFRPGNKTSLDTLTYSDVLDTQTLALGYNVLGRGAKAARIGKMTGGMELKKHICLGSSLALEGLWQDPAFTEPLQRCLITDPKNPNWSNDLPDYRGLVIKRWEITTHDNPGPTGSSIAPEAILGDASATAGGTPVGGTGNLIVDGTTTFDIYGGGRTQTTLGDAATLYKPFELFYGCDKLFGKSISTGADSGTYYFVVIDPADGKWGFYSYVGTDIGSNGFKITITSRLGAAASGARVTTLGNITYDSTKNKMAFPSQSVIIQANANAQPIADTYLFGKQVGAKCYGTMRDVRKKQRDDYEALAGTALVSIYGQDVAADTLGLRHRRFVRLQSVYPHPLGILLPPN